MRTEQLRDMLRAQPFRPFTIYLPEGRAVQVVHHDFALLSPDGRTLVAYGPDSSFDVIDVMLIASIQVGPLPPGPATAPPIPVGTDLVGG
jgi:hypothetical protein